MSINKKLLFESLEQRYMLSVTVDNPSNHLASPGQWEGVL
jgi:hypothetical protein